MTAATRTTQPDACGCGTGAVFAVAAMVIYGVYLLVWAPSGTRLDSIWTGIALIFGSALAGKMIGLARARRKHHQTPVELRGQLP
jgi:hypothetical protein